MSRPLLVLEDITARRSIGAALLLGGHMAQAASVGISGLVNVCVGLWTLMPVPSLDGWMIWSILIHWKDDRAA